MKVLNNKLACFIVAIVLLFTGMCSGIQEADSFFAYNMQQPKATVLSTSGNIQDSYVRYTRESISSARDVLMMASMARRVCMRVGTRMPLVLSQMEITSQILFIYLLTVGAIIGQTVSNETVILRFIHHKDGKK